MYTPNHLREYMSWKPSVTERAQQTRNTKETMKAGPREYNHYYRRWVWLLPSETDFQLSQGPVWVYNHQLQFRSFQMVSKENTHCENL